MKTSEECLAKMEDLVRRMASCCFIADAYTEARGIVAELDGPHNDDGWAEKLTREWRYSPESGSALPLAKVAIAKGRELEFAKWEPWIDLNEANIAGVSV